MTQYRRNRLPGGRYFFTVNLADRRSTTLTANIALLRQAMTTVRRAMPFRTIAIAVLPDHLHCIWALPDGDADYSTRWKKIKAAFSRSLPTGERRSANRVAKGERGIWQRRFWEHTLRDEDDLRRHVDYIHYNPVKHGHATQVADWPYSSFHRYVRRGVYPADWADSGASEGRSYGEGE